MSTADEDAFFSKLKTLHTEYSRVLTENTQLKAQLHDVQRDNTDLKSELKETRALLGEAIVNASKQPKNAVPGPSKPERAVSRSPCSTVAAVTGQTQKRARSPSVEQPAQKKAENDKPQPRLKQVYSISVNEKSHQQSYPTPSTSSSGDDAKRRRIDPKQNSPSSSSLSRLSSTSAVLDKSKPYHQGKIRVPESIISAYLSCSPPLPISPPPLLDLLVPRNFLRLAYGGSDQHFVQYIPSTGRRMVFPTLVMDPAMPIQPGHAGLMFPSRHEKLLNGPWTVFCKPPETGKALWLYLGEYTKALCGKLTAEEFRIQRDVVKKLLRTEQKVDEYISESMRARIALRKAGVLPVDDAEEWDMLVENEIVHERTQVTEDDIIEALNRGDEGIDIMRMTCVKYDHAFANDIKLKFLKYPEMLLAEKKRKELGGGDYVDEDVVEVPMRRASLRRKGKERVYDVDDEDEENEDDDDDDDDYKP